MAIPDGWRFAGEMQGHYHGRYVWIEPMSKRNPIARDEAATPRPSAGAHRRREPVPHVCPSCYGGAVIDGVDCSLCQGEGEVYE
jgi:hypothetical protein